MPYIFYFRFMLSKKIGQAIREQRKARGYSVKQLAAILGVDTNTVYRYEAGAFNLSTPTIERIAKALDCEVVVLFQPR